MTSGLLDSLVFFFFFCSMLKCLENIVNSQKLMSSRTHSLSRPFTLAFFQVAFLRLHLSLPSLGVRRRRCQMRRVINNPYQSCLETVNFCPGAYQRSPGTLYNDPSIASRPAVSTRAQCPLSSCVCVYVYVRECVSQCVSGFEWHS